MDAADWDTRYAETPSLWTDRPNQFLVEAVSCLVPGRALDLGCGEGRNAIWLATGGWSVTAVDFSLVAVERGRRVAGDRGLPVEFVLADVTEWAPPVGSFDLVVVLYLHLPDMAPVIGRAAEAVAAGGTLLAVGHHLDNLEHGHGGPRSPEVLYTEHDLARWAAGLETVEERTAVRTVDTPDGPREALDALVRAVRPPG
jgi:SAM-dependent methyltransferase